MQIKYFLTVFLIFNLTLSITAEIPTDFQKKILSKVPQTDINNDGKISIDEVKQIYPKLPARIQKVLSDNIPELGNKSLSVAETKSPEKVTGKKFKRPAGDPLIGRKKGYNCLFMGHSYFYHIIKNVDHHAANLGLSNHEQFNVFHGGANGAPGKLWKSPKNDVAHAKTLLKTGDVELLALTAHHIESDFEDYKLWIDLALDHNPNTIIVIQSPWPTKQNKTLEQYTSDALEGQKRIYAMIDKLRLEYSGTRIMGVPQGQWMVDLWNLYEDKKLPELTQFVANTKPAPNALFRDDFGHGGELAESEGVFIWLNVIYGINLNNYACSTKTKYDLKALSQKICDNDPYTDFPE